MGFFAIVLMLKYPTRSRPEIFRATLHRYLAFAQGPLQVVVSIDRNDRTMNNPEMLLWIADKGAEVRIGDNRSKVEAINADIPSEGWDVLVLASDDHIPVHEGWDTRILQDMEPDCYLWYKDGRQDRINFMPIMDRTFYQRTGYIYHPSYRSLWCDNEQTEVAVATGRCKRIDHELFRNESPDWGGAMRRDNLYKRNNQYWNRDKRNYMNRKKAGFP